MFLLWGVSRSDFILVVVLLLRSSPLGNRSIDEDIGGIEEFLLKGGDILEGDSGDVQVVLRSIDDLCDEEGERERRYESRDLGKLGHFTRTVDDHGEDRSASIDIGDVDGLSTGTVESSIGVPDGSNVLLGGVGVAAAAGVGAVVPEGNACTRDITNGNQYTSINTDKQASTKYLLKSPKTSLW